MSQSLFNEAALKQAARNLIARLKENPGEDPEEVVFKALQDMQARGSSQSIKGAIRNLQVMTHDLSRAKGWYEGEPRRTLEFHMLIVSEIAEATESFRNNEPPLFKNTKTGRLEGFGVLNDQFQDLKLEGELAELADAAIRIFEYCQYRGWDLGSAIIDKHYYNATRPHRHGGKAC